MADLTMEKEDWFCCETMEFYSTRFDDDVTNVIKMVNSCTIRSANANWLALICCNGFSSYSESNDGFSLCEKTLWNDSRRPVYRVANWMELLTV